MRFCGTRTRRGLDGEVDDALAAAQVDRVDLLEERQRVAAPELLGARGERADVLRQASAAEADARVEEPAADARVVADGVRERRDVGAGRVGDLGHRVDEAEIFVARNAFAATFTSSAVA
jgi:Arc/MetJ family transcription regulator